MQAPARSVGITRHCAGLIEGQFVYFPQTRHANLHLPNEIGRKGAEKHAEGSRFRGLRTLS